MTAFAVDAKPSAGHVAKAFLQMAAGVSQLIAQAEAPGVVRPPRVVVKHYEAAAIPVEDWFCQIAENPSAVRRICHSADTVSHLLKAVEIAKAVVPGGVVRVRAERDREDEGEWVVVDTAVPGPPASALQSYKECVARWVQSSPPAARELIHLGFHLT